MANMKTYLELLQDPRWDAFRKTVYKKDNYQCIQCSTKTRELHAHHLIYISGRMPWDYPLEDMATLCYVCHCKVHDLFKEQYVHEEIYIIGHRVYIADGIPSVAAINDEIRKLQVRLQLVSDPTEQDYVLSEINYYLNLRKNEFAAWQVKDREEREQNSIAIKEILSINPKHCFKQNA